MNGPATVILAICTVFALWMSAAYTVARRRTGLSSGWLPVLQWLLLAAVCGYAPAAGVIGAAIDWAVVVLPLVAAVGTSLIWRSDENGARALLRRYPNGALDVMLLRQPNTELKQRVRGRRRGR